MSKEKNLDLSNDYKFTYDERVFLTSAKAKF